VKNLNESGKVVWRASSREGGEADSSSVLSSFWMSVFFARPCTFHNPFSTSHPLNTSHLSPQYLSTLLPSRHHTLALFCLLLLAFLASSIQHLLNSYLLFGQLSQTPRTFRRGQSRAKKWARDAGYLGGSACFASVSSSLHSLSLPSRIPLHFQAEG